MCDSYHLGAQATGVCNAQYIWPHCCTYMNMVGRDQSFAKCLPQGTRAWRLLTPTQKSHLRSLVVYWIKMHTLLLPAHQALL